MEPRTRPLHPAFGREVLEGSLADFAGDTFMDDPRSTGEWREAASDDHSGEDPPFRFVTLARA